MSKSKILFVLKGFLFHYTRPCLLKNSSKWIVSFKNLSIIKVQTMSIDKFFPDWATFDKRKYSVELIWLNKKLSSISKNTIYAFSIWITSASLQFKLWVFFSNYQLPTLALNASRCWCMASPSTMFVCLFVLIRGSGSKAVLQKYLHGGLRRNPLEFINIREGM